ncbi:hypothetical protein VT06_05330 [Arsukibacterium sp. MJ3]|nr:hypothetical protein VT06_05330 [Arsukibacterium sp. MJ3]
MITESLHKNLTLRCLTPVTNNKIYRIFLYSYDYKKSIALSVKVLMAVNQADKASGYYHFFCFS